MTGFTTQGVPISATALRNSASVPANWYGDVRRPSVSDASLRMPSRSMVTRDFYAEDNHAILMLDLIPVRGYSGAPVLDTRTGAVVAVYHGESKRHPQSGFTIAEPITRGDLEAIK